jgi:hypothetical protein
MLLSFNEILKEINNHTLVGYDHGEDKYLIKLQAIYDAIIESKCIEGSTVELGVYWGGVTKMIAMLLNRTHYAFDTFTGIPNADNSIDEHKNGDFSDISLDTIQNYLKDCNNIVYCIGEFPMTITDIVKEEKYSFVHFDGDTYKSTKDFIEFFHPRMNDGGIMIFDDYAWRNTSGVKKAVDEYCECRNIMVTEPTNCQAKIIKA